MRCHCEFSSGFLLTLTWIGLINLIMKQACPDLGRDKNDILEGFAKPSINRY
jgi:hypothetical protein